MQVGNPTPIEIGLAVFIAFLVIDKIMFWINRAQDRKNGVFTTDDMMKMCQQVSEMHHWHAVEDEDGVKVWYVPRRSLRDLEKDVRGLVGACKVLGKDTEDQTDLIRGIGKQVGKGLETIHRDLKKQ